MAHEKLNINLTREWAIAQGKVEPDIGVTSVGGLAYRLSGLEQVSSPTRAGQTAAVLPASLSADPRRQSLGKFVELSRRQMRVSVEQLADKADVDLTELLAIEKGADVLPELRTVYQLAQVLRVRVEPLLELAGLVVARSTGLTESALRFAARSEPMDALTKEEEEALNRFVKELSEA